MVSSRVELMTYVFYDIEDDRVRGKIADACLDYGLARLQYSVFVGPLSKNRREEVFTRLLDLLGEKGGKLIMQPVCESDVRLCRQTEQRKKQGSRNAKSALPASSALPTGREPA
jgi:CRISPR-associated protein Cas2